jgi:hypothetical protein
VVPAAVVYVKNTEDVATHGAAVLGGRASRKGEALEWIYIPDAHRRAALNAGEVDWWEQMLPD